MKMCAKDLNQKKINYNKKFNNKKKNMIIYQKDGKNYIKLKIFKNVNHNFKLLLK